MSTIKGYIDRTWEAIGENDAVIGSAEVRIHYRFLAGDPGCRYLNNGDPGYPPSADEIEFDYAEQEIPEGRTHSWQRLPADHHLSEWAESWLDDHHDDVREDVAESEASTREQAAEMRAEDRRNGF